MIHIAPDINPRRAQCINDGKDSAFMHKDSIYGASKIWLSVVNDYAVLG